MSPAVWGLGCWVGALIDWRNYNIRLVMDKKLAPVS